MRVRRRKTASQVLLALRSKRQRQNYYVITRSTTTELSRDTHKFVQERNIFPVFGSKESELIHVKHSTIEQNLLQVTTCQQSKLDKIGRLGLKYMSNKNVCMTTEHNNFLTVISKEITVPNCGKLAKMQFPIPTSCNNQHLLRLRYLARMI